MLMVLFVTSSMLTIHVVMMFVAISAMMFFNMVNMMRMMWFGDAFFHWGMILSHGGSLVNFAFGFSFGGNSIASAGC
jgi:hypothetical protein